MRLRIALLSLLATYAFFYEYLPPQKRVHFYSDIEGYHYPLLTYTHNALRVGRLPEWDPTIYSGLSFVGNPQVSLFYPPTWLLMLANPQRHGVHFTSIEAFEIAHFWLAFVFAWMWLRGKTRDWLPAVIGASAFAFGGYMVAEVGHLGMVCGYAWFPLALLGVDESARERRWRPLWKTAVALAMSFLAGYPTTAFVLAVMLTSYSAALGVRTFLRTMAACAFAGVLAMVQLAPSLEASKLKLPETQFGNGWPNMPFLLLQFVMPNYYDHSHGGNLFGPPAETYLYIGAAAILGIVSVAVLRRWRQAAPALAMMAACLFIVVDPYDLFDKALSLIPMGRDVCREWNFLTVMTTSLAMLTAVGLDAWPETRTKIALPATLVSLGWCVWQLWRWRHDGVSYARGWASLLEVALAAGLVALLYYSRAQRFAVVVLLLVVWTEYKTYGTSRRFNSTRGSVDEQLSEDLRTGGSDCTGVDPAIYQELLVHPDYRIALLDGPHGTDLRHYGLTTPQGFEPFLPQQYRDYVEQFVPFETNRLFEFDWRNDAMLDAFAVRYVMGHDEAMRKELLADPRFRRMEPARSYFDVFEYVSARPVWRFDVGRGERSVWKPERRVVRVSSSAGGEFQLREQFFPGWQAYVDGAQVPIARVDKTFQRISVPPGEHTIEFRYRSIALRWGAAITLAAIAALAWFLRASGSPREKTRSPAQSPAAAIEE